MSWVMRMFVVAGLVTGAAVARADEAAGRPEPTRAELGVGLVGASAVSRHHETVTSFGMPAGSAAMFTLGGPLVFAALPVGAKLELQPQAGVFYLHEDGDSLHVLSFAGQAGYLFGGHEKSSPYVFARVRLDHTGGIGDSTTYYGAGAGLGYRVPVGDRGVVRFEGRWDHIFPKDGEPAMNVYSAAVCLGVRL